METLKELKDLLDTLAPQFKAEKDAFAAFFTDLQNKAVEHFQTLDAVVNKLKDLKDVHLVEVEKVVAEHGKVTQELADAKAAHSKELADHGVKLQEVEKVLADKQQASLEYDSRITSAHNSYTNTAQIKDDALLQLQAIEKDLITTRAAKQKLDQDFAADKAKQDDHQKIVDGLIKEEAELRERIGNLTSDNIILEQRNKELTK